MGVKESFGQKLSTVGHLKKDYYVVDVDISQMNRKDNYVVISTDKEVRRQQDSKKLSKILGAICDWKDEDGRDAPDALLHIERIIKEEI